MFECPECGRQFEPKRNSQIYCQYKLNSRGQSICMKRAGYRRWYRNAGDEAIQRKRGITKEWKKQMKVDGRCNRCGNAPAEPGFTQCSECNERVK